MAEDLSIVRPTVGERPLRARRAHARKFAIAYVGLVDTDMASFADSPKSGPAEVVRQVLDGIESGANEVLADEILSFARDSLPAFKVPRSLDFVTELPRSEAGKIQRNKVRAPYWEGRARQI